ncbi:unnamed protein product [Soboliphyme baturini]|uniref:DEK_C domain-containing protein n=1 Tax=Soboliphyme baturini TaxID=241478 RepID=A0A183IPY1_9BILA|nr:unnamed protein product [Soboliphyme baturini]
MATKVPEIRSEDIQSEIVVMSKTSTRPACPPRGQGTTKDLPVKDCELEAMTPTDPDRLPQLLVKIAEEHNINLTDPDALEKIKFHLKATVLISDDSSDFKDVKVEAVNDGDCSGNEMKVMVNETQSLKSESM